LRLILYCIRLGFDFFPLHRYTFVMADIQIRILPRSEIEINGELAADILESFRSRALKNLSETVNVDGFRKGHIPENLIAGKIGETGILEEMAELALAEHYPKILSEHALDAISRPEITLTKLARGNPLGFNIRTAIFPKITLPDYEKIMERVRSKKEEIVTIEDAEVEEALGELQKLRAGEGKELPALDDDFAKSVSPRDGGFKTLDELRAKVRESMLEEKQARAKSKKRAEILDAIVEKTGGDIPDILIEGELRMMLSQFKQDIAAMGVPFEEYLKRAKRSEEDIAKDMRSDAEKRVKINLMLKKIAEEEKISPDAAAVERETARLLEHYKNADPARTRSYVEMIFTNKKVLEFFEDTRYNPS